jgi:hypothetical protein
MPVERDATAPSYLIDESVMIRQANKRHTRSISVYKLNASKAAGAPRPFGKDGYMPAYTVQCFEGGVWNDQEPLDIDADTPKLAAEAVCGGSLREGGKPGELRAQVWPKGKPAQKHMFYGDPNVA